MAKVPRAPRAPKSAAKAAGSESPSGAAGAAAPAGGADQAPPAALEPSSVSTDGSGETAGALDQASAVSNDTQRASQDAPSIPPAADPAAGAEGEPLLITARSRDGQAYRRGGLVWTGTFAPQLVAADRVARVWADPHLEIEGEGR